MSDFVGWVLGPYKLEARLGTGGMSTVYRAIQTSVKRYVAVKVMSPEIASQPGFVERFEREAELIAHLEHPHIIPLIDYGKADALHYLVMRYIEGGSLEDRMRRRPLTLTECTQILDQVAAALDYAHRHGVIHRDIKPNNILLDQDENAYITDFGIARLSDGSQRLTTTGAVVGTPAYLSPEQGQGQPVDARSDIYSLGVVLYEMVTNQPPFSGITPVELIYKHVYETPRPVHQIRPDLPDAVAAVLNKALAKDAKQRYGSARELVDRFREAAQQKVVSPRPPLDQPTMRLGAAALQTAQAGPAEPTLSPPAQTVVSPVSWRGAVVPIAIVAALIIFGGGAFLLGRGLTGTPTPTSTSTAVAVVPSAPSLPTTVVPPTIPPTIAPTTAVPTVTATLTVTLTPTLPTATPTESPTSTVTATATIAPSDTPTATATVTPSSTSTPTIDSDALTATALAENANAQSLTRTAFAELAALSLPSETPVPSDTPTRRPASPTPTRAISPTPAALSVVGTPNGGYRGSPRGIVQQLVNEKKLTSTNGAELVNNDNVDRVLADAGRIQFWPYLASRDLGSFVASANIAWATSDPSNGSGCGLAVRHNSGASGGNNTYAVLLSRYGTISVYIYSETGSPRQLVSKGVDMSRTNNVSNQLLIVGQGSEFRIYVNGLPAAVFTDSTFKTGSVGVLAARDPNSTNLNCKFRNVWVWRSDP